MGRRARGKPFEEEAESPPDLSLGETQKGKDLPLHERIGDPDGAAAQLDPVVHGVIVERTAFPRVAHQPVAIIGMRRGEWVVGRRVSPAVGVELEQGKIHYPGECMRGERDGLRTAGERRANGVQRRRSHRVLAGHRQQEIPLGPAEAIEQLLSHGLDALPLPSRRRPAAPRLGPPPWLPWPRRSTRRCPFG